MKNTKKLYTLYEWELLCRLGLGIEYGHSYNGLLPIECPNVDDIYLGPTNKPRACKSKIKDITGDVYEINGQKRIKVYCPTCFWNKGSRAVGKDK